MTARRFPAATCGWREALSDFDPALLAPIADQANAERFVAGQR
ncbi:hypothetical protein [Pseudomonas sp. StFLB209]|nr:hypothetical protein [Pseudomonas sp. StFLB209]